MIDSLSVILLVIIVILVIALGLVYRFSLKQGRIKGQNELMDLILKGGYHMKVAEFRVLNRYTKSHGIVFVGDSITQSYPVHEFFPNLPVYNRGIGGDTTVGLSKRLQESVFDLHPAVVVLLIGTNDFALLTTTPLEIVDRIQAMITTIRDTLPETKIVLQSIYPVNPGPHPQISTLAVGKRRNEDIKACNQLLVQLPHVHYVDMFQHLVDTEGHLQLGYTTEGLHISSEGYQVITSHLLPIISELIHL